MNLAAGTTLQNGKYYLGDVLGQGQFCTTLQATQSYLNQTVVLKTIRPNLQPPTDSASLKHQFIEEARRFAQCQHPGLVRVVDLFIEGGVPFAATDYVAGQSLESLVQSRGPLSEVQAVQYIRQVGSALSVVHRNGLAHQDVAPKNLIRPQGADFVVLVDFGMAHQAVSADTEGNSGVEDCYAAIEQFQSQAQTSAATDIYALAGTLYFLLTGQKPIAAPLRGHIPLPSPRQLQPQISSTVEAAILRGLEVSQQSRPQTIAAWFSLLPGGEALPPVHEFSSSKGAPSVQLPPAVPGSNGSKTTASPAQPVLQETRLISPPAAATSVTSPRLEKGRFPKALIATAAISGGLGLGLGMVLRFSAMSGIGPRIFHTQQSFPPLNDWPGSATPAATPLTPLPPPPEVKRNFEPPVSQRLTKPASVIASPSPTPQPSPEPSSEPSPVPSAGVSGTSSPAPNPLPQSSAPAQPIPSAAPIEPTPPATPSGMKSKEGT